MTDTDPQLPAPENPATTNPVPETQEGYTLTRPKLPEGVTWDEAFEKAALPVAHSLGLTPQQLQGLAEFYAGHQSQSHQSASRSRFDEQTMAIDALKSDWGAGYDTKIAQAARAARYFGGETLLSFLNDSGAGNNPDLVRAFAKIGALLSEDNLKSGDSQSLTLAPDEAMRQARKLMGKPGYTKSGHPEHSSLVEKVQRLFEQAYGGEGG